MTFRNINEVKPDKDQSITVKMDGTTSEYMCWYDHFENGFGYGKNTFGMMIEFDLWTDEIKPWTNKNTSKSFIDNIGYVKSKKVICKVHGEYDGYIMHGREGQCPHCAEEARQVELAENEKITRERIAEAKMRSIFDRSSFPKIFKKIQLSDWIPTNPESEKILSRATSYVENFKKVRETGSSVLFIGGTGTGKSMLSAAIGNAVMAQGYTVMYMTCPQAISWIKRSWATGSEKSQDEYMESFKSPDLLILDEVPKGCKNLSEWEMIHEIIDRRYQDVRPTISISTLPEQELEKKMTKEITRRMYFRGRKLFFDWKPHEEVGMLW